MATLSNTRIGFANTYDNTMRNLNARQSALSSLQENISSGKRVVRASDDPTGAAQAERALTRISRIAADQRALESQVSAIKQAESTLGEVTDALHRFRSLVVNAGDGTLTASNRSTIANELKSLRDQVFDLSNTKDSNGLPLFGALGSALAPLVGPQAAAPDYTFNGLPGTSSSSDVSIPFTLDGDSAFMLQSGRDDAYDVKVGPASSMLQTDSIKVTDAALVTGSSYEISAISIGPGATPGTSIASYSVTETLAGAALALPTVLVSGPEYASTSKHIQITLPDSTNPALSLNLSGSLGSSDSLKISPAASLISVLDNAINDIGSAASDNSAIQAVSQALNNLDIGMERVSNVRGQAGALLNRADRIAGRQETRSIQAEADRSRAEDLDMIKGLSDFQNQETGYSVALQTYAKVQKLSLFDYIS